MTIRSIQKVINVGSSLAVTIPARDAKALNIKAGDNVISEIEPQEKRYTHKKERINAEYEAFKQAYGETLKNLADR